MRKWFSPTLFALALLTPFAFGLYNVATVEAQPTTASTQVLAGAREPVRVATTAELDELAGLPTIDGIEVEEGDRVLVKDESDAALNGIYIAQEGQWQRAPDARSPRAITKGVVVRVQEGSTNANETFRFAVATPVIGTDDINIELVTNTGDVVDVVDGSVTTAKIEDGAVTSAKIADATIDTEDIAPGAVETNELNDSAVTSAKIADGTIVTGDIATDGVQAADIAAGAVGTSEIADGSIAYADASAAVKGGLALAWARFNGDDTVTINDSYNIASIVRNAEGHYTVTMSAAAANANYAVIPHANVTPTNSGGAYDIRAFIDSSGNYSAPTTTTFMLYVSRDGVGLNDARAIHFVVYGDR